ncbi:MAG: hypothetical protein ACUVTL_00495 [Thermoproteota archaeon]
MAELLEKAFVLSLSMILIVTGLKMSQTTLYPKISAAAALMQYNALVDKFRNALLQASAAPVRIQFDASIPSGFSMRGDGNVLVLNLETSLGSKTDRIQSSMHVSILGSIQSGDVNVVIDSTNGEIRIEIGGV